jgi:hypothetical protein
VLLASFADFTGFQEHFTQLNMLQHKFLYTGSARSYRHFNPMFPGFPKKSFDIDFTSKAQLCFTSLVYEHMKVISALGPLMLSLLLVVALDSTPTSPNLLPEGEVASAQSQQHSNAADGGRAAPHALWVTQQSQTVDTIFIEAIEAETDFDHRSEELEHIVESVADDDVPARLDSLTREGSPATAELRQLLVRRWAESDAPAAAAWTSQLSESAFCSAALKQVAIAWANSDLSAATGWVHTLPEGDSKQSATIDLAYEAARTDPIAALELAGALPRTRERDDLLVLAVSQWAVIDPSPAAAWAMNVLDSSLRQHLIAAVAIASAGQDGAGAAALAASALEAGDEQEHAAVSIVQRWTQNFPQAAASWVSQFPDIPSRTAAVQNLLALWIDQDAQAAGRWLCALPVGSLRDVGMTTYARAMVDRD